VNDIPVNPEGGMRAAMGAYAVGERMLGDLRLTVGQLAQLRAIDAKYQQSLFRLLDGAQRRPTNEEGEELDTVAARDILDMLTPDQRLQITGR
jgi:hypothetical protein